MKTFIDKDSLPEEYDGDLPVPFVAGNLLVDLLKHYNEEVERKITSHCMKYTLRILYLITEDGKIGYITPETEQ